MPGVPHHLTQRGNRQEQVFHEDRDYRRFLELLALYAPQHGLSVLAYCLMPNHVHLVAVPQREDSLGAALKPLFLRYAQHVNWRHKLSGRLWQGRFFSCPMDEAHSRAAIRYVERNPVRASLVRKAEQYAWSSAAAHCGLRTDSLLADLPPDWSVAPADWSAWLAEAPPERELAMLRAHTRTGRPAGSAAFVSRLESMLGRVLVPRKGGRPRKDSKQAAKPGDATHISDENLGSVPRFLHPPKSS